MARELRRQVGGRVVRALGAVVFGAGLASACGSRVVGNGGVPTLCTDDTDCSGTQVCVSGRCNTGCETSADCPEGARCVVEICQLAGEPACQRNSDCPAPLLCASDGQCRSQCASDRDCPAHEVCSSNTCVDPGGPPLGTGGRPSSGGGGAPVFAAGGSPIFGTGGAPVIGFGGAAGAGGGVCGSVLLRADPAPVDAYVLFDQSSSMSDVVPGSAITWWDTAVEGFGSFTGAAEAQGARVGLQYFPLGNGIAPASCTALYSTPDVPIAALSGNVSALILSLGRHAPGGFTPTGPALNGAITHLRSGGTASPERVPIAVLVTDGFPTECEPGTVAEIAAIASAGLAGAPSVRTAVIALSAGLTNLSDIADAGGTSSAFLIESGDVGAQVAAALVRIVSDPGISCRSLLPAMPPGIAFNPTQVNLRVGNPTGLSEVIPSVGSETACAANGGVGWYYDSPAAPTGVGLCPNSCSTVRGRELEFAYGCASLLANSQ